MNQSKPRLPAPHWAGGRRRGAFSWRAVGPAGRAEGRIGLREERGTDQKFLVGDHLLQGAHDLSPKEMKSDKT